MCGSGMCNLLKNKNLHPTKVSYEEINKEYDFI